MRGKGEQIFYEGDKVMIVHLLFLLVGLAATGPLSGADRLPPALPEFGKEEMATRLLFQVKYWVGLEGKGGENAFLFMTGQEGDMTLTDSEHIRKAVGGLLDNIERLLPGSLNELLKCEWVGDENVLVNNTLQANATYIAEALLFLDNKKINREYFSACMKRTDFGFYLTNY